MTSFSEPDNLSPNVSIPAEWSDAAEAVAYCSVTSPPPIALVCGAKNCGKSTFSRYLLNIFLQRYKKVGYLDTDVGQPEFSPPGFLSLTVVDEVTPDLTIPHMKTAESCLFFGDVSSKRNPTTYLNCICALYDYYQKEYCKSDNSNNIGLPLVVNTPGWVKGIGYDILVDMLKYISPTHVVKINISAQSKNLPNGPFWLDEDYNGVVNLTEISSARQDSLNRSQCFSSNLNISTIKELAHALASHPPYEVPISSIKIRHLHCQVPGTEIFYSLNGSIVGLAVSSEGSKDLPWCCGLGIVRSIDTLKGLLYVITPVPQGTLEKVDLLLQGFIQIPTCLLQVQGSRSPYMSANVLSSS